MSAGNSTYSPLPQSNSDSDGSSEEELHVSQGNRFINRAVKTQTSKCDRAKNEIKNNIINYKPLDNDGDVGVTLNKFHSNPDEVSILKPYDNSEIFSTSRKICFAFSLLLCVFTTVAFIWILPCNVGNCPSTTNNKVYNFTWEQTLSNLEIYGPNSWAPARGRNFNLIFLTRSHIDYAKNYSESGLWCVKGKDGSPNWKIKLNKYHITDVNCKLIDVNADGLNDCLICGMNSLKVINSLSGKELWDFQRSNKNERKVYIRNFPLIIPDLNKDEINELLLIYSCDANNSFTYNITIVSGKNGAIINEPLQIEFCSNIKNLMFNNSELSYTCQRPDGKDSYQKVNLVEIYKSLRNSSNEMNSLNWEKLTQHSPDSNTVYADGFKLKLVNQGNCPENCSVLVDIKDQRGNKGSKTIYSCNKTNTYGMIPVLFKTERESGFILKFWKWCSKKENSGTQKDEDFSSKRVVVNNITKNIKKRSKKLNFLPNTSKILDNEMLLESEREFLRKKRTAMRLHKSGKYSLKTTNFNLHVIYETVVKITLNDSSILISNIAKDEIIQVCKKPKICQPNAQEQRHSILVTHTGKADMKLIRFTSTYVHVKDKNKQNGEPWKLQSTIAVSNL